MDAVDAHFVDAVPGLDESAEGDPDGRDLPRDLPGARLLELFDVQAGSRHLDLAARDLRARGQGFYTIGSSGHESNAAVAAALRPTDPALLHYRSGAFYLERARQGGLDGLRDVLLGLVAAVDDPISGGRHKVFGRHELAVIPQTSTIASHLPRALGVAFAIGRARRLGVATAWADDAVAVCSFGDASANHSTATGAINAAIQVAYRGLPLPLLLVCEDNGLGISVPTPSGWIAHAYGDRPGLDYVAADGGDPADAWTAARTAVERVRRHRRPVFLHLRTVRLMAHAGTDLETAYRRPADIAADLARDPLLGTARLLVASGTATPAEILDRYEDVRAQVAGRMAGVLGARRLGSAAEVMAPLRGGSPDAVAALAHRFAGLAPGGQDPDSRTPVSRLAVPQVPTRGLDVPTRGQVGPDPRGEPPTRSRRTRDSRESGSRGEGVAVTVAQAINGALRDVLAADPGALLFGEDVGVKGGVYGVTRGLHREFGAARVFDTLLDEQTILGLALGAGVSGLLPIPEIQYLAYLHNAEDQLRGEAATLPFFSAGRYRNPLVVRIAGYAYQKGFGGHFHNDNAVGVLRDIPGLVIASPARPDDAAAMLRTCAAAARTDGAVCAFLEPIALYHTRDLHDDGDGGWLAPDTAEHVPVGRARSYGTGTDLTIVTWANGLRMSLRVAARLARDGIGVRVVDLRWLAPLPVDDVLRAARATGRVLVVDETRRSGGVSEGVLAALVDARFTGAMARVAAQDSVIPLGDAADHVLVSEPGIESAARRLVRVGEPDRSVVREAGVQAGAQVRWT